MSLRRDLQMRQVQLFAESERLRGCEHRAYSADQQIAALQSNSVKLQLHIDELRMKYEPSMYQPNAFFISYTLPHTHGQIHTYTTGWHRKSWVLGCC